MARMVIELPRKDERRGWTVAVAASVILHGTLFAVLPKHVSYRLVTGEEEATRPSASAPAEASPPIVLSFVTEVPAEPTPVRSSEAQPNPDAAETPTEPTAIAETGAGTGAAPSDAVGEPAPAGVPGEAHVGPPGEPSGLRRGVPAMGVGEGVLAGARINAPTDVRAIEPVFDSSAVSGEQGQDQKGGGLGGFLRGVGDFLEGIEIRGGGQGGPGGGGGGGFGGSGTGGKGGGCGPKIPNVGIPQGPIRPGGRIGVGMGGRPMGGQFESSSHAAPAEARCSIR